MCIQYIIMYCRFHLFTHVYHYTFYCSSFYCPFYSSTYRHSTAHSTTHSTAHSTAPSIAILLPFYSSFYCHSTVVCACGVYNIHLCLHTTGTHNSMLKSTGVSTGTCCRTDWHPLHKLQALEKIYITQHCTTYKERVRQ